MTTMFFLLPSPRHTRRTTSSGVSVNALVLPLPSTCLVSLPTATFSRTPLLAEFLYGVKAHDMLTVVLVSLLLMAVTFIASYVPARHATKIDPMRTLRHE